MGKPHFGQRAGKPNVVLVEGHQLLSRRVFLFPVMVANNSTGGHLVPADESKGWHCMWREVAAVDDGWE